MAYSAERLHLQSSWRLVMSVKSDISRFLFRWMAIWFPRQTDPHPVVGRWTPSGIVDGIKYGFWALIGLPLILSLYPVAVLGIVLRRLARVFGVVLLSLGLRESLVLFFIGWGAVVGVVYKISGAEPAAAISVASSVGAVSLVIAFISSRQDSIPIRVLVTYPSSFNALFLPPVAAAVTAPFLADVILPLSTRVAQFILQDILSFGGIGFWIAQTFELVGFAHILMWIVLSLVLGWTCGLLVTAADFVRPTETEVTG